MLPINPFIGPAAAASRPRVIRRAQDLTRDAAVAPDESNHAVEGSDALHAPTDGEGNPRQRERRRTPHPPSDRLDLTA